MDKFTAKELWVMDKEHFIHPYTNFATFHQEGSRVMTKGEGLYLTDADGHRCLDAIAGLWCVNVGHGRKEMADAIAEQVLSLEYSNPFGHNSNAPGAILAAKLAQLAPGDLNHVLYTCGGSTANDAAIRLVHYYNNLRGKPNKKKIISRMDAYHGSTYVSANLTGIHATKDCFDRVADEWIDYVSAANMYRRPVGAENLSEADYCQFLLQEFENRVLQLGADNVAAFIAEPIMGAGGVLVAPAGYHRGIYEICQRYDLLYIADEVVTGFGRLGEWFASQSLYDMVPDIIVSAKGITSGYQPLGAAIISSRIFDVVSQPQSDGGVFSMGFTYTGHPVACAAALKNIEIIERENLLGQVKQLGPLFEESGHALLSHSIVGDVRGSHFMMSIEMVTNKVTKDSFDVSVDIATRVFEHCRQEGVIVRPVGSQVILSPPLTLGKAGIIKIFSALHVAIEKTTEDLIREGLWAPSTMAEAV